MAAAWEEAEPGRGQLWVALRAMRSTVAVVVVSYSSYIPLVFPKPPVKSCSTIQPGLSWAGTNRWKGLCSGLGQREKRASRGVMTPGESQSQACHGPPHWGIPLPAASLENQGENLMRTLVGDAQPPK